MDAIVRCRYNCTAVADYAELDDFGTEFTSAIKEALNGKLQFVI